MPIKVTFYAYRWAEALSSSWVLTCCFGIANSPLEMYSVASHLSANGLYLSSLSGNSGSLITSCPI